MNSVELLMRRRNVKAFIDADPVTITFQRTAEPTKSAAGGRVRNPSPVPVPQQKARIVHNTRRYKTGLINSEAGDIPQTDYLLIGLHTLNVEAEDKFTWSGPDGTKNYKIKGIHPFRNESILCGIEFDGPDNRDA
jgi:hypothetical protein